LQNNKDEEMMDIVIEQHGGVHLVEIKTTTRIGSNEIKGFGLISDEYKVLSKAIICQITSISSYSKDILLIPNTLL
jgi:hypothetical protein